VIAIVDNDVMAKLTRYGLLSPFLDDLARSKRELRLTPRIVATFDLENRGGKLDKLDTEAQRAALAAVAIPAKKIALNSHGQKLVDMCHNVEGIDPGDSVWLAAGASEADALVYTGDKVALRAAAGDVACRPLVALLAGRCHCLEQIILGMFDTHGIAPVRKAVLNHPDVDGAIPKAFAKGLVTTKAEASAVLLHEIDQLRARCAPLLA
jgi:hypothetical protein